MEKDLQIGATEILLQGWSEESQHREFEAADELQQCAVDLSFQLAAASAGLQQLSKQVDSQSWSSSAYTEDLQKTSGSTNEIDISESR